MLNTAISMRLQVKQTHNEIDRCAVEIDNLRKELLVVISHWKTKENDCVRLTETIEVMEKQFQRHHGVAEALQIARSTADVELGKIKASFHHRKDSVMSCHVFKLSHNSLKIC